MSTVDRFWWQKEKNVSNPSVAALERRCRHDIPLHTLLGRCTVECNRGGRLQHHKRWWAVGRI